MFAECSDSDHCCRFCGRHGRLARTCEILPDVVYFAPERAHLIDIDRTIEHAPDLCVEVLSPSTQTTDRGRKMQIYARYGVREYWIVDPRTRTVEIYRLEDPGYVLAETAF